jgi:cytosine/adenosine deaminase-related metal-dependent hydrolase
MIGLHGVRLIGQGVRALHIKDRQVVSIAPNSSNTGEGPRIHFENALAFPGLINSHDHLEFNLFPRLGRRTYSNCVEWGKDIQAVYREIIGAVLKVPKRLRAQWGVYKNLLNGVTTVVHHGDLLDLGGPPINVFQDCNVLHSVRHEPNWRLKLNNPLARDLPFVVHVGEGTDAQTEQDIDTLIRWNALKRRLIAVHGVAMTTRQAEAFAALVWCPDSNTFLLGRTADIPQLQRRIEVVFGSDSTLTANWNLWDQLRLARALQVMDDATLFESITSKPAELWGVPGSGMIREGSVADIVVARSTGIRSDLDAWFAIVPADIALVIQSGRVRLCDADCYGQLIATGWNGEFFSRVKLGSAVKYVEGDLPELMRRVKESVPGVTFPITSLDQSND